MLASAVLSKIGNVDCYSVKDSNHTIRDLRFRYSQLIID